MISLCFNQGRVSANPHMHAGQAHFRVAHARTNLEIELRVSITELTYLDFCVVVLTMMISDRSFDRL